MDKKEYKRLLRSILSTDDYIAAVKGLDKLIKTTKEEDKAEYAIEQLKKFAQVRIDIQKAERERCAVIAETWIIGKIIWTDDLKVILLEIAKAIRSEQIND